MDIDGGSRDIYLTIIARNNPDAVRCKCILKFGGADGISHDRNVICCCCIVRQDFTPEGIVNPNSLTRS